MKIRVIPSSINLDTFRALGANPVPIQYSQLYVALQNKTAIIIIISLVAYTAAIAAPCRQGEKRQDGWCKTAQAALNPSSRAPAAKTKEPLSRFART